MKSILILLFLFSNNTGFCQTDSTELKYSTFDECFNKLFINIPKILPQVNQPLNVKETYLFGSEYFKNKSYSKAIPYLWKVFLNDSAKYAKNAIRKIADAYYYLQNQDSTLYACYVGLKRFPTIPRLHYYAAFLHENNNNYECALYHYEVMVNIYPDDYNYFKKLKVVYEKYKQVTGNEYTDLKNRIEKYFDDKYLEIVRNYFFQPDIVHRKLSDFQDRSLCGHDLNNQHELTDYYTIYLDSCKILYYGDSTNIDYAYLYLEALFINGSYEESNKILNNIKLIDNNVIRISKLKTRYYLYINNYKQALSELMEIIRIDSADIKAMLEISNIYRWQNKFDVALSWLNKAKKLMEE